MSAAKHDSCRMLLQVVKAIWVYIKEHNLQDPKNKRKIIPDEKLGKILPRTNMMMMNKHLSKHVYTAGEVHRSLHHEYDCMNSCATYTWKAASEHPRCSTTLL